MSTRIAPQAIIDPRCELDQDVEIGPFCVVGRYARIGQGTRLSNGVTVVGHTTLGRDNIVCAGAMLGIQPHQPTAEGDAVELFIGSGNVIREGVTIAGGLRNRGLTTILGDACSLGPGTHVAHGCRISDGVQIEAGSLLGIATHLADGVRLGRGVITHDMVSIGALVACLDGTHLIHDAPPYLTFEGSPARARGVNFAALRESDVPTYIAEALHEAHRLIYQLKIGNDRVREMLRQSGQLHPAVNHMLTFLQLQQEGRHGRSRQVTSQQPRKFAA